MLFVHCKILGATSGASSAAGTFEADNSDLCSNDVHSTHEKSDEVLLTRLITMLAFHLMTDTKNSITSEPNGHVSLPPCPRQGKHMRPRISSGHAWFILFVCSSIDSLLQYRYIRVRMGQERNGNGDWEDRCDMVA
jgi:hypothetical protein